jgi:hypothetical protein
VVSPASLLSKQKEILIVLIVLIEKTKSINPSVVSHESLASEIWYQFFKLPPHNTSLK